MKRIVLCADDYGQALAISQGIIALIQKKRLSATSCMVNTEYWLSHSKWLQPLEAEVDIGLHFNLTEGCALSADYQDAYGVTFMPLSSLLFKSLLRRLKQEVIEKELEAQIDEFFKGTGFMPHFIDGHQHVHQFPVIRDALLKVYEKRLKGYKTYVRLVKPTRFFLNFKKTLIYSTGTIPFKRSLDRHDIPYNQSFAGIYLFYQANHYKELFMHFLATIKDGGLVMCHPALKNEKNDTDPIAKARFLEYQYLNSDQFIEDCLKQNILLEKGIF